MHVLGWSTRELRTILRGLDGLFIVSADIVEVAPAYDTNAELTTMAAADVSLAPSFLFRFSPPSQKLT
jgi:agmatinase